MYKLRLSWEEATKIFHLCQVNSLCLMLILCDGSWNFIYEALNHVFTEWGVRSCTHKDSYICQQRYITQNKNNSGLLNFYLPMASPGPITTSLSCWSPEIQYSMALMTFRGWEGDSVSSQLKELMWFKEEKQQNLLAFQIGHCALVLSSREQANISKLSH